jgi:hypothetical protein
VLADTEPLHWRSWAALLSRYDVQFTWEEYCRVGRGVNDTQMFEAFRERVALIGRRDRSVKRLYDVSRDLNSSCREIGSTTF